jgi:hypothetical protein
MKLVPLFIFVSFLTAAEWLYADEFEQYQNTCKQIGFKPKTPDFGDCVLELRKRDLNKKISKTPQTSNSRSTNLKESYSGSSRNNNAEYEAQANEHFRQQQDLYDMQMAKYQREEAEYLRQRSEYDAQIAKQEAAAEKRKNLKLIELGLRAMSGTSPNAITNLSNASADTMGIPRLPEPQRPTMQLQENYRITTPNGNLVNCRYDPNIRQATCY